LKKIKKLKKGNYYGNAENEIKEQISKNNNCKNFKLLKL
jgi:hypothetical protein